jgi:hypothetical protein
VDVPPFSVAHASRSQPVHGRVAYRPSKYFINHNAARPRFSQTKLNSIPVCGLLAGPPRTLTGLISPSFRPVRGFTLQTSPSFRPVQLITIFTGSSNWPLTSLAVRPVRLITISTGSSSWPWARRGKTPQREDDEDTTMEETSEASFVLETHTNEA